VTRDYLFARLRLQHRDCWIAGDGSRPVAYVETFMVPDDPLASRYEAQPGDRGFALLVGPPELLGSGVAQALVRRLVRVLLHQAAITRVVCECDVRNARLLTFCRALGAQDVATLAPPAQPATAAAALLLGWTSEPRVS
jgi:RimJ/RimL family protein N-acetyltransferase